MWISIRKIHAGWLVYIIKSNQSNNVMFNVLHSNKVIDKMEK